MESTSPPLNGPADPSFRFTRQSGAQGGQTKALLPQQCSSRAAYVGSWSGRARRVSRLSRDDFETAESIPVLRTVKPFARFHGKGTSECGASSRRFRVHDRPAGAEPSPTLCTCAVMTTDAREIGERGSPPEANGGPRLVLSVPPESSSTHVELAPASACAVRFVVVRRLDLRGRRSPVCPCVGCWLQKSSSGVPPFMVKFVFTSLPENERLARSKRRYLERGRRKMLRAKRRRGPDRGGKTAVSALG